MTILLKKIFIHMPHLFVSELKVVKGDYILTLASYAAYTIFLQGQFFTLLNRRTFVVASIEQGYHSKNRRVCATLKISPHRKHFILTEIAYLPD